MLSDLQYSYGEAEGAGQKMAVLDCLSYNKGPEEGTRPDHAVYTIEDHSSPRQSSANAEEFEELAVALSAPGSLCRRSDLHPAELGTEPAHADCKSNISQQAAHSAISAGSRPLSAGQVRAVIWTAGQVLSEALVCAREHRSHEFRESVFQAGRK